MKTHTISSKQLYRQVYRALLPAIHEPRECQAMAQQLLGHYFQLNAVRMVLDEPITPSPAQRQLLSTAIERLQKQEPIQARMHPMLFCNIIGSITSIYWYWLCETKWRMPSSLHGCKKCTVALNSLLSLWIKIAYIENRSQKKNSSVIQLYPTTLIENIKKEEMEMRQKNIMHYCLHLIQKGYTRFARERNYSLNFREWVEFSITFFLCNNVIAAGETKAGRKREKNVVDKSKYWCTEQNNQKSDLTNQYRQGKRCWNWEHEKSDQKAEFW